ncbi:MAG: dethiobiotin synthase [Gammaproteobacteria bacterium]
MARGYFITGTDTGVGKTLTALGLMRGLQERGRQVVGMKPIACGGQYRGDALCNEDALALQQAGSISLSYRQVNPVLFEPPIAPHIAAQESSRPIDVAELLTAFQDLASRADCVVVEGAGGWLVPLNKSDNMATLAQSLALPVILVVGLRLGCLNHALLTAASIHSYGLTLAGWVANHIDPGFQRADDNIAALEERIPAPLLARLPRLGSLNQTPEKIVRHFQSLELDQL